MAELSSQNTPKRKRPEQSPLTPIKFSFDVAKDEALDDGSSSPGSKVAHRFRGLELNTAADSIHEGLERLKRQKPDELIDANHLPVKSSQGFVSNPSSLVSKLAQNASLLSPERGHRASASPRPRARKRAGTPPLRLKRLPVQDHKHDESEQEDMDIPAFDPIRASLTWHEDEITVYDPDDEDDDGTGINGVGFKPTPALAHARALKRQQQMLEYRRREESEARSKRSQRRREGDAGARHEDKIAARKVRFMDAEKHKVALSTGCMALE